MSDFNLEELGLETHQDDVSSRVVGMEGPLRMCPFLVQFLRSGGRKDEYSWKSENQIPNFQGIRIIF